METIKVSIEVSVNLSEATQNFISSLFTGVVTGSKATSVEDKKPAATAPATSVEDKKPAATAPAKPTAAIPAEKKPAAAPAPTASAAPASSATKSIEDVRKALAEKVNDHRAEIKEKLNELGAPSVTKMDPAHYDEMYNFLMGL